MFCLQFCKLLSRRYCHCAGTVVATRQTSLRGAGVASSYKFLGRYNNRHNILFPHYTDSCSHIFKRATLIIRNTFLLVSRPLLLSDPNFNLNKTDTVRTSQHWGAFVQPLLPRKTENYYIFWVCVCSLRYRACNAHAPCFHLWPVRLYSIFPRYLINRKTL